MNSKKNSMVDTDEDLKFIPLTLNEPFKSKDSSWAPLINFDVETENMTNNFFISLPDLQTNNGFTPLPSVNANPILPYPISTTSSTSDTINNYDNMNLTNNLNIPPDNTNNINDENELYPSEISEDELYSYNTNRSYTNNNNNNNNNNNSSKCTLTHLDILRDFDLSIDSDIKVNNNGYRSDDIDRIFNSIEENDGDLLGALKAYNVPYPIASLILKKTIKSAINNLKNE